MLSTHWGRVTHKYVSKVTIIGSDNGLSPGRRQAIIWTNAGILWIRPLGTNFNEILIEIYTFSFKKMHLKMSSAKCRLFCLGFNVLKTRTPSSNAFTGLATSKDLSMAMSNWVNEMNFVSKLERTSICPSPTFVIICYQTIPIRCQVWHTIGDNWHINLITDTSWSNCQYGAS